MKMYDSPTFPGKSSSVPPAAQRSPLINLPDLAYDDPDGPAPTPQAAPPRSRLRVWRNRLIGVGMIMVTLLVITELSCRFFLGLGNPPLLTEDPDAGYLYRPSAEYHRFFWKRVSYNAFSMRSDDFAATKADPREFRVLVIGDSVTNGGARIDQADIATSIVQRELRAQLPGRTVYVGNISAGGWNAQNMAGYVRSRGLYDADVVVLVLASHDAGPKNPNKRVNVDPDYPGTRPTFAISELVTRYFPFVTSGRLWEKPQPGQAAHNAQLPCPIAQAAIQEMIDAAHARGAKVLIVKHLRHSEMYGNPWPAYAVISQIADRNQVPVVENATRFKASINNGQMPLLDDIHPNLLGQKLMGLTILDGLKPMLPK